MSKPYLYKWPSRNMIRQVDNSIYDLLKVLRNLQLISNEGFSEGMRCSTTLFGLEEER